jgi:hypothetical protein
MNHQACIKHQALTRNISRIQGGWDILKSGKGLFGNIKIEKIPVL